MGTRISFSGSADTMVVSRAIGPRYECECMVAFGEYRTKY